MGHVAAGHDRRSSDHEAIEPAIAADRNTPGRVYVAYSRLNFADANCTGSPPDSEIYLLYSDERRGFGVPAQARVADLPFRRRSLP